jgi:hypothetical protein
MIVTAQLLRKECRLLLLLLLLLHAVTLALCEFAWVMPLLSATSSCFSHASEGYSALLYQAHAAV